MKCKYCDAQWEEESAICPSCGKTQEDEPEQETVAAIDEVVAEQEAAPVQQTSQTGVKWWKILLVALAGAVLGTVLTVLIMLGCGVELFPAQTEPTQEQLTVNDTYYVDAQTAKDQALQIVAAAGENELTNGRFQIYYWSNFVTFLQNNGMYYFDLTSPLADQYISEGTSWETYFVDSALSNWHCYAVLCQLAEQDGFVISQESQEYLDDLPEYLETLAQENDCADAQTLVEQQFGPGATVADYILYMQEYSLAMEYYAAKHAEFLPTDEEIEAYFIEHEADFATQGITKETKVVDVRHILVCFESETGTQEYTDQEKENCKAQAQAVLDQWLAGEATEESFGLLAQEFSEDPGSASEGGLYEDVTQGYMTTNFDAWIFDANRQVGDYGLVETEYGYHVMFFSGSTLQWPEAAKTNLIAAQAQDMVLNAMEIWPADTQYDKLVIGEVDLGI